MLYRKVKRAYLKSPHHKKNFFFLLYPYEKMDGSWAYCGHHFVMYVNQTVMLYALNSGVCQLFFTILEQKKCLCLYCSLISSLEHWALISSEANVGRQWLMSNITYITNMTITWDREYYQQATCFGYPSSGWPYLKLTGHEQVSNSMTYPSHWQALSGLIAQVGNSMIYRDWQSLCSHMCVDGAILNLDRSLDSAVEAAWKWKPSLGLLSTFL